MKEYFVLETVEPFCQSVGGVDLMEMNMVVDEILKILRVKSCPLDVLLMMIVSSPLDNFPQSRSYVKYIETFFQKLSIQFLERSLYWKVTFEAGKLGFRGYVRSLEDTLMEDRWMVVIHFKPMGFWRGLISAISRLLSR